MANPDRVLVTVLYEDSRGPTRSFGLHDLLLACVADVSGADVGTLHRCCDPRPMKGASNVVRSVREDAVDICADGRRLVAVLDADRIREALALPGSAAAGAVAATLAELERATGARILLLDQNVESVLAAVGDCDPTAPRERVTLAVERKDRLARDELLKRTARRAAESVRRCIEGRVPSVVVVRDALGALLSV